MLISLAAKPIDIDSCAWYKFLGKQKAKFLNHNRSYDLELESGDVFGLKPMRNGNFYLYEAESLDIRFKLKQKEGMNLLKRSRSFKGKVAGKSTKNSLRGAPGGFDKDNSLDKSKGTTSVQVEVSDLRHPREDAGLTKKLQRVKSVPAMNKIEFVQAREILPGEIYYFYDAVSNLRSYRRRNKLKVGQFGNWAKELERAVEKEIPGIDVEVGTVRLNGEVRHLLVVVDT